MESLGHVGESRSKGELGPTPPRLVRGPKIYAIPARSGYRFARFHIGKPVGDQ